MLRQIWVLSWKELRLWFKKVDQWMVLFVAPILFIVILGASFSGEATITVPVYAANEDTGERGEEVMDALLDSRHLEVEVVENRAEADRLVGAGKRMAAIVVPAGFSDALLTDAGGRLELIVDPARDNQSKIVNGLTQASLLTFIVDAEITRGLRKAVDGVLGDTQTEEISGENRGLLMDFLEAGLRGVLSKQVLKAIEDPLIKLEREAAVGAPPSSTPTAMVYLVPGFALMFVFFLVKDLAIKVVEEREVGTLPRLLMAPVSRGAILAGKALPFFVLAVIQLMASFTIASAVFDYPLVQPLAMVVVSVCTAAAVAGLGIMIAALARTEGQAGGLTILIILVMGVVGGVVGQGSSVPGLRNLTPHYWAHQGFADVMTRGVGVASVWLPCVVLLGMATFTFVIGVTRFRFE
jgi:ABC-2 type transport system permease protein